jgi:magnesium transporter
VTDPATGAVKGVITIDDVFDAADEEAAEDLYRMAGAAARDPLHMPAWRRAVARLPWLLITLVPGFLVGQIMRWLGYDPGGTTALLLFVPVMIAMAGNVSLQSSTVMVRGIATGDVRTNRAMTLLLHEVVVAAMVGVACATVSGSVAYVFFGHHMGLGLVVAFSMFVGILSAATTGTMVPLTCHAIGLDPALASGPFVTSLNDITGTLIFLGLGGQLLPLLGD